MSDYNIWKNDIKNRFPFGVISENDEGDGFVVDVVISGVTHKSAWQMSLWDAYKNLREQLLGGIEGILPKSTTAQRDALTGILDGAELLNVDTQRAEVCFGSEWISTGGTTSGSIVAFGSLWQDEAAGTSIAMTANTYAGWVSAYAGHKDKNNIISFLGSAVADRLVVGAAGTGVYMVEFHASLKNSGNNLVTAAVHVNGVEKTSVKMSAQANSAQAIHLSSAGPLPFAATDYLDLRFESSSTSTLTLYQANLNLDRIEI